MIFYEFKVYNTFKGQYESICELEADGLLDSDKVELAKKISFLLDYLTINIKDNIAIFDYAGNTIKMRGMN